MAIGRPRRLNWKEVVDYMLAHPMLTAKQIAQAFSCNEVTIQVIARKENIINPLAGWRRK